MEYNTDKTIFELLPSELWAIVISYLPRISRHSLSKIYGFQDLIDSVSHLEDRKLYFSLKSGNKLQWHKVKLSNEQMQKRLKHGSVNFNDQILIFGGASSNSINNSGMYNDVWIYNNYTKYKRMKTSSACPSPKSDFGIVNAGNKMIVVGGKSSVGSSVDQPYSGLLSAFEIHSVDPKTGVWQKIQATGTEPQISNGIRCVMLSKLELIAVAGLIPIFHNWDAMNAEENVQYRTSLHVSLLKFTDASLEKGHWYDLANFQNRRGFPTPRNETHLVNLGNDCVLMFGGRVINGSCQDAWIMKFHRNPYSIKWIQVTIENPLLPSLPTHIFPSCLINDLLVFTGVRTSLLKKPEIDKQRNVNNINNNNNNDESQKSQSQSHQPSPSPSSSSSLSALRRQKQPEVRRVFINSDRPLHTIGTMAAFSVVPQKVLKMQVSPDPSPPLPTEQPKRLLKDYPMRIFCLDLSNIMNCSDEMLREKLSIKWIQILNDGLFPNAPELRAHATFTRLDKGLFLIGGVKRSETEDDALFTQATNEIFMLTNSNNET
ncbi:uncharacterized protein [Chironomus tepperi]|uniref:uncharacterized protein n=1 Tax=Chironomus tepperi TaxID=113505 RepID=UPI00391F46E0